MAHTHLHLSASSASAVLVKYGPGKFSCVIGWDRTQDTFVRSQCLRSKLECPDFSPDGRFLAYYLDTHTGKDKSVRRVVSRWPWLKAVAFWSASSWTLGPGPGLFTGTAYEMWANDRVEAEWDEVGIKIRPEVPMDWETFVRSGFRSIQLHRDGWTAVAARKICSVDEAAGVVKWHYQTDVHRTNFQKLLPGSRGWKLQLTQWCGIHGSENRGISFEAFALVSPEETLQNCDGWNSADYDAVKDRVVWTRDNALYGAKVDRKGLQPPTMLYDASDIKYQSTKAPY